MPSEETLPFFTLVFNFWDSCPPRLKGGGGGEGVVGLLYKNDMDGCQKIESKPWPVINVGVVET